MAAMLPLGNLTLLIELGSGLLVLLMFTAVVGRWPGLGFALLSGVTLALWEYPLLPALATVASITIYPSDVLAGVFVIIALVRARQVGSARPKALLLLAIPLLMLALSILRGVRHFGLGTTINEARPLLLVIAAVAWVWGQAGDPRFGRRLHRFIVWTGCGLVGVALWHISLRGLGTATDLILVDGQYFTGRPLVSTQACFLALAGLHLIVSRRMSALGWLFMFVVLLVQHRSVWLATAAGLFILVLRAAPRVRRNAIAGILFSALIAAILIGYGAFPAVLADLKGSAQSTGTLDDRTFGWTTLITAASDQGLGTVLFGMPVGSGWARVNSLGLLITYSPHNWYVTLFLRIGVIGAAALVALLIAAATNLHRHQRVVELVWLTTLVVYLVPYNMDWNLAPFLALALARIPMLTGERTAAAPTKPPVRAAASPSLMGLRDR